MSLNCDVRPAKEVKKAELTTWSERLQLIQNNKIAEADKIAITLVEGLTKNKKFTIGPDTGIWQSRVTEALRNEMQFSGLLNSNNVIRRN